MLYRQGDVVIMKLGKKEKVPASAVTIPKDNDFTILAYGESTGHSHRMEGDHVHLLSTDPENEERVRYLIVDEEVDMDGAVLVHDEHDPIEIPPGNYKVIRQREYEPPPETTSTGRPRRSSRLVYD